MASSTGAKRASRLKSYRTSKAGGRSPQRS